MEQAMCCSVSRLNATSRLTDDVAMIADLSWFLNLFGI